MGNTFSSPAASPEHWPGDPTHQPAGEAELARLHAWADAQLAHAAAHTAAALLAATSPQAVTEVEDETAAAAARAQAEAWWARGFAVQLSGTAGMGAGLYATKARVQPTQNPL